MVAGCAGQQPADESVVPKSSPGAGQQANPQLRLPPSAGIADYQLGGVYAPAADVQIVTRDSTAESVPGIYSICYVNAFQSQPGAVWPDALLVKGSSGIPITDPGWPDEHVFDISTDANRVQLLAKLSPGITGCVASGFDAVEFDNLDSFTRSGGVLSSSDALTFAKSLVGVAHAVGLAAAQKNSVELAETGAKSIGFDFAMTEECFQFAECDSYTSIYGEKVIDVEYSDNLSTSFAALCASPDRPRSTMLRDRGLKPAGDPKYVYQHC